MPTNFKAELVNWFAHRSALQALAEAVGQFPTLRAGAIGAQAAQIAAEESPRAAVHTAGQRFAESWRYDVAAETGGASVAVSNTDPKAALVFGPTRPHLIPAKHMIPTKKGGERLGYLRFEAGVGGQVLYRHQVQHPGTAANDILGRVGARIAPVLETEGANALGQASNAFIAAFGSGG